MAKKIEISNFRLPVAVINALTAIAKLAGLSLNTVTSVVLAMEVHRYTKNSDPNVVQKD